MIEIIIDDSIVAYATNKLQLVRASDGARGLSKFGSERQRILVGYIGEKIIMNFLKIDENIDDYNFDLISSKGRRLEVKTITCQFKPTPDFWCTVNSHDLNGIHKQEADYYIFLRIRNDFKVGWILGWISCAEFFNKGQFIEKGKDFGKFQFIKANATILPISDLNRFKND